MLAEGVHTYNIRMIDCFLKSYNADTNVVEQVFEEIPGVAIILDIEEKKQSEREKAELEG